ncbi:RHS repeat-associated core domain-containing protein [Streptomyces sp. NPDC008317]|uniref:RHS repeat domain-containing protein n=1 Tax=Streptomyces sp. NPDC008317 TaxID=3364827 RepID=UPI0036E9513C
MRSGFAGRGRRARARAYLPGRRAKLFVVALAAALTVPVGLSPLAHAAPGPLGRPDLPAPRNGTVHTAGLGAQQARAKAAAGKAADDRRARRALAEQHTTWPKGSTLKSAVSGTSEVTVLDRAATDAAGVRGVLLAVTPRAREASSASAAHTGPAGARVHVSVDYSSFASAYGGDWSGRLRLVRLPACALTTPQKARCRTRTPVPSSVNDLARQTISADVSADAGADAGGDAGADATDDAPAAAGTDAGTLSAFAVTADSGESAKGSGDYGATPLSASSKWSAGTSSGSFDWSYPMEVAPSVAGPVPAVTLTYDSGSIDGRTASTNNQGSQVGEGFTVSADSYVERQYGGCDKDGHAEVFDQCWKFDNASVVLNGKSTELVKDDTTGKWRLADDDASTVTHSTGADNGDEGDSVDGAGEYWTVTTGDGTQYVFGLNKLTGAGTQRTNSVWTVPVFGDDSGEPGYAKGSAFADRSYNQAWRWNLDYVVDTHGNAESYWYTAESNFYKKNGSKTANASYTRGGHLDKILYGQRSDTLFSATAPYEVTFGYTERCTASDCSKLTKDTAHNWPDVPFDAICASGASDTDCAAQAPSFFTRKRLTSVQALVLSGTSYTPVDTWALAEKYLDAGDLGDSSDQTLVLDSIKRTGEAGTAVPLDPVSFTYQMLANRVDATDDILPLHRPRIQSVTSETGAVTSVTMSTPECVRGSHMPAAEDSDTMNCYPQYWHINGAEDAGLDWFHKYRVVDVTTSDPAGNNEALEQSYVYTDPAWHYNDSPFTPDDERTWSVFRGYGTVTSYSGTGAGNRLRTVTRYMQGMNGDKVKAGGTRTVTVAGLTVPGLTTAALTDSDQYAGFQRQQVTYNGDTPVSATVNDPWSVRTATQHKSYADVEAYYVRTAKTYSDTYLTVPAKWRTSTTASTYDSYGMPVTVDDAGDTAKSGDETCTRTWYARNDSAGINSLTSRVRTVGQPCGTADASLSLPANSTTRGDVLADTATVYDSSAATAWTANQSPAKGDAMWKGRAAAYPAGADANGDRNPSSWQTTGTSAYDTLGRMTLAKDGAGNPTSNTYTPTGAGVPTRSVITNAKSQKTTTFYDGLRGLPTTTYDVNTKKTELTYDGLGRLTGVWQPGRVKSAGDSASIVYGYHMERGSAPYVSTSTLGPNNVRRVTYQIDDALLRPLQTQSPSPLGGRVLTDTRYDSRGLAYETFAGIFDQDHTPSGTYARAEYGGAPTQHEITFDGAGRTTSDKLLVYGVQKGVTVTSTYTGDSTATSAQPGGTASRVITDALGRTVERRDYSGASPADADYGGAAPLPAHTSTLYGLTRDGKQSTATGPDNAKWSWGYDLFGRQVSANDPDMGATSTTYNALDQIATTTGSTHKTLLFDYDTLGRKTGEWETARTDATKIAAWTYDTAAAGQLDTSTRYDGGLAGKAYTQKVTAYDDAYHVTGSEIDLDANDPLVKSGAAKASYSYSAYYNVDGSLQHTTEPAVGGLPQESVSYGYTPTGQIETATGTSGYLQDTSYSALGEPQQLTLATAASGVKKAYITNVYEEGTSRLTRSSVTDQTHAYMTQDLNYSYDDAGNVTKIADPTTQGGTAQADTQCFGYDGYQRMTSAWTPANADCASTTTGGAAPYSTGWTYNPAGLRLTRTQHTATGDSTAQSCYNDPAHPHALTTVTAAASCTGATATYGYDEAGDTTKRPGPSGTSQTLAWNSEGDLTRTTEGAKVTDYLYDAGDNLLIRRASAGDGESVVYLGATEIHSKVSAGKTTTWAVRTYTAGAGGPAIAVRSTQSGATTLTWLAGDNHGTSSLAVDAGTQAVTKRYTDPFGAARGSAPATAWPDDKTFLGKPADTGTGLVHIGAREYDPSTGRFISVDPLLQTDKAQTLNGYVYAADNPTGLADPTGEGVPECMTGVITGCHNGVPGKGSVYHPDRDPGNRPSHSGGKGNGNSNSSGSGGCDRACQNALAALQQNTWKDDKNEKNVHAALAKELRDYVLALAGNTNPCKVGASVTSGTMAACNQMGGNSPQLTWTDLLQLWLGGKGANVPFDANSLLTKQLAFNGHSLQIIKNLARAVSDADFGADIDALGGQDDYVDGKNLGEKMKNLPKDLSGMATRGRVGTKVPEAFTGGYDLVYQVINQNKKDHSMTVAFAAFNDTGTASAFHFGVPDIKQGYGGASVYQEYYWSVTVSVE